MLRRSLWNLRWQGLIAATAAAVLLLVITALAPVQYRATAEIYVGSLLSGQDGGRDSIGRPAQIAGESLWKSVGVDTVMLEQFSVAEDPEWQGLYRVAFESSSESEAKRAVKDLVNVVEIAARRRELEERPASEGQASSSALPFRVVDAPSTTRVGFIESSAVLIVTSLALVLLLGLFVVAILFRRRRAIEFRTDLAATEMPILGEIRDTNAEIIIGSSRQEALVFSALVVALAAFLAIGMSIAHG